VVYSDFIQKIIAFKQKQNGSMPDVLLAERFILSLFKTLFYGIQDADNQESALGMELENLEGNLTALCQAIYNNSAVSLEKSKEFFEYLPILFDACLLDAMAIFNTDPAAKMLEEVLVSYPGFFSIYVHRVAFQLHLQQVPILPRMFSEIAHSKTGIDIHPAAKIGNFLAIDHGTGIVIGETTVIGNEVKLYQGVTLGALSVQKDLASEKRHPTIEDRVVIYGGVTILGGDTTIGHDSIIGGNVWITQSVAPFSIVMQQQENLIMDKKSFSEPLNFII